MSALARLRREQRDAGRRALLGVRDSVTAAVTRRMSEAGSLAIEEAVDGALDELLSEGAERCELAYARNWWISWAKRRLIANQRLSRYVRRDPVPVEEHPRVLAQQADDDPLELLEDELVPARLAELVASLPGAQREWVDGLFGELERASAAEEQGDDYVGAPLHELLGWSAAKEKKTAQRARQTITAFVNDRGAGTICRRRQSVLDAYIAATDDAVGAARSADADRREFQAVALHLAGCPECQIAWARRRRTLLGRFGAFVLGPLDGLAAAAHALAGKLAGVWTGTQQITLSLLQRLGIGGGTVTGATITLTGKTVAVCAGVVCAATAGGELTGILPPIVAPTPQHKRVDAARKTAPAAPASRPSAGQVAVTPQPPPPPARAASRAKAHQASTTHTTTAPRASSARRSSTSSPRVTPGDLSLAIDTASPTPTKPSSTRSSTAAPSASTPSCFPGDLRC